MGKGDEPEDPDRRRFFGKVGAAGAGAAALPLVKIAPVATPALPAAEVAAETIAPLAAPGMTATALLMNIGDSIGRLDTICNQSGLYNIFGQNDARRRELARQLRKQGIFSDPLITKKITETLLQEKLPEFCQKTQPEFTQIYKNALAFVRTEEGHREIVGDIKFILACEKLLAKEDSPETDVHVPNLADITQFASFCELTRY